MTDKADAHISQTSAESAVRVYCTVSVRQNLRFSVGMVFECLDFESELDFDRQTPHSKPGQNPDSAVRRRLLYISMQIKVLQSNVGEPGTKDCIQM